MMLYRLLKGFGRKVGMKKEGGMKEGRSIGLSVLNIDSEHV